MKESKKSGGGLFFIFRVWKPLIASPLNMVYVCVYLLQLGYPFFMSHYHLYESLYSTNRLLLKLCMESVLVIVTLYKCSSLSQLLQVNSFVMTICLREVSLCWPSIVSLAFQFGHPYARCAQIVLSFHPIYLCQFHVN